MNMQEKKTTDEEHLEKRPADPAASTFVYDVVMEKR